LTSNLTPSPARRKTDSAWLERMFNNRALVPEHGEHFARWARDSEAARCQGHAVLDLPYGTGPLETLDVFPASVPKSAKAAAPVMVFVHGGYWRSLDKADHSFVAPAFTRQGACVVVINYALCPTVTVSEICLQTAQALAWVWRNIGQHGGDPSRVTVVGHSAGGHLAAMMLACNWEKLGRDLPKQLVKNALSISGLYELEDMRQTPSLQVSLQLTPEEVARVSPARFSAPLGGQLVTVAGGSESAEFIRHNGLMQKVWGKQRVPVAEVLPGLNHFSIVEALGNPSHRLHHLVQGLLGL
jgi:arylformamidase